MSAEEFHEKFRNYGPFPARCAPVIRFKPGAPERIEFGKIVYALYFPTRRLVKIGVTSHPRARFRTLSHAMCEDAFWFAAIAGDHKTEREAHERFALWRMRGEFFKSDSALVGGIEKFAAERNGRFRKIDLRAPRYT